MFVIFVQNYQNYLHETGFKYELFEKLVLTPTNTTVLCISFSQILDCVS